MLINMRGLAATQHMDFSDEPAIITGSAKKKSGGIVASTVHANPTYATPGRTSAAAVIPRAPAPAAGLLDRVLPLRVGFDGKTTIYGLPPALAYACAAALAAGSVYYGWKRFGRPLVVANPSTNKRRNGRRGRSKSRGRRASR